MNRNQVIGSVVGGVLVFVDVTAAFEAGRNCSRNCFGSAAAIMPELVHVPHGNNNHFAPHSAVMSIAGGSGNNNFA